MPSPKSRELSEEALALRDLRRIPGVGKSIALDFLLALAGFFGLQTVSGLVLRVSAAQSLGDVRALPAVMLLGLTATVLVLPLKNTLSRYCENEADRYALTVYPSRSVFDSLMNKLAERNLANRSPSRWEEFFLFSHPSVERRIENARRFFEQRPC